MDTKYAIALHILAYIAESEDEVTSEMLAISVGTNASHIRKIITLLKDANILESQQGKIGIKLKVKPENLPLDKVYNAVYPKKELLHIHDTGNPECPVGAHIQQVLIPFFEDSQNRLIQGLQGKTLQALIQDLYQSAKEK